MSSEKLETLERLLGEYKNKELEAFARTYKIRGYSFLDKGQIVTEVTRCILEEATLRLTLLSEEELRALEEMCNVRFTLFADTHQELVTKLEEIGWVKVDEDQGVVRVYLAKEIASLYSQIKGHPDFVSACGQMKKLRIYRNSLLNLYGLVEITWLKQIYQRDTETEIDMRTFIKVLKMMNQFYTGCQLINCYIVHESLYCTEAHDFDKFRELVGIYDYYEPVPEVMEALENEFYYEENVASQKVKEYLKNHCAVENEVADFAVAVLNVHMKIQEDVKMVNMLQVVEEWYRLGIPIGGVKQLEGMIPLVLQMMSCTRMWRLKGHTPEEVGIKLAPIVSKEGRMTQEKHDVGRNDPCPCGSGKKYKKCCLNKSE
ncbi:MAG: YecA family protein [Cellulosilyticaceae bacterium]